MRFLKSITKMFPLILAIIWSNEQQLLCMASFPSCGFWDAVPEAARLSMCCTAPHHLRRAAQCHQDELCRVNCHAGCFSPCSDSSGTCPRCRVESAGSICLPKQLFPFSPKNIADRLVQIIPWTRFHFQICFTQSQNLKFLILVPTVACFQKTGTRNKL